MATRKTPAAKKTTGPQVLVRMYNVGFGDCFLIEFPHPAGVRRVLVDCGSIAAPASLGMSEVVDTLLDDVRDADGTPRIDVVVCTHRHADHVSGFARPQWKDLQVREVWFPWTEDPVDPVARRIRETQSRLALAMQAHWQARLAADGSDATAERGLAIALNALSNEAAMTRLHGGFKPRPKPRYLSSDGTPTAVPTSVLPDITAYVLGPSKAETVIRDMDPPAGKTFLRQMAENPSGEAAFEPFGDDWPRDAADYPWAELKVDEKDRQAMRAAAEAWTPAVAVALEKAVNGTSLALVFEYEDAVLFFPGDAQWGTWDAFMSQPRSRELLSRARFWKVGHHGSHNATPKDFVDGTVGPGCCAMVSVKRGKFASIPRQPLLDAIHARGIALARSDEPTKAPAKPFLRRTASIIETRIPVRPAN